MTFLWKLIKLIDVCNGSDDGDSACLSILYLAKKAKTSDADGEPLFSHKSAHHATAVITLLLYPRETSLFGLLTFTPGHSRTAKASKITSGWISRITTVDRIDLRRPA